MVIFEIDIVLRDIPGLIGMDILSSKYNNRGIFSLNLGERTVMIDDEKVSLLGKKEGHLHLPNNVVKISFKYSQGQSFYRSKSYFQEEHALRGREGGRQSPGVGQERVLEGPPQSPTRKTLKKGKLKPTLIDIQTPQDSAKRLGKKDHDRLDVKLAKKEEFFKI